MALVMALSCTVVALAAEVSAEESSVVVISNEFGNAPINSARAAVALTDVVTVTDIYTGKVVTGNFYRSISSTSNVTIVINTPVSCTVDVKTITGHVGASKPITPGTKTVTIGSGSGWLNYEIRYHGSSTSASAFQFMTTDAVYPQ